MAVADAGYAKAGQLAEAAVRETEMGVAVDKKTKNEMASVAFTTVIGSMTIVRGRCEATN